MRPTFLVYPAKYSKTHVLTLLVGLALLLSACGEKEKSQIEGGHSRQSTLSSSADDTGANPNNDNTTVLGDVPTITPNEFNLPALPALEGSFLFVQGDMRTISRAEGEGGKIFLVPAQGGTPELLVDHVYSPSVRIAPNQENVVYTAVDGRHWIIYALNIETRQVTELTGVSSQFASVGSWSPDSNWVVVNSFQQGAILAKVDGTSAFTLGNVGTFWTADNRVLVLVFEDEPDTDEPQVPTLQLLDPTTQVYTPLELGTAIDFENPLWLTTITNELAEHDVELASTLPTGAVFGGGLHYDGAGNFYDIHQANPAVEFGASVNACDAWTMTRNGEVFYEVADTVSISDFQVTPQGTAYFVRWYLEACRLVLENLRAELVQVAADGTSHVVQRSLFPGSDMNLAFLRATNGAKYALSPDEQVVISIDGSLSTRSSSLIITDLTSGTSFPVLRWDSSISDTFLSREAFTSVFWLN